MNNLVISVSHRMIPDQKKSCSYEADEQYEAETILVLPGDRHTKSNFVA